MDECEETTFLQPADPSGHEDVIAVINRLIQVNYDAINGYKLASQWAEKREYADLFQTYCLQREGFVAELSGVVADYGGTPVQNGTLGGMIHQSWLDLKAALTDGDGAIIAECERGDEAALQSYQTALQAGVPEIVRHMIRRQLSFVRLAYEQVHTLHAVLRK